MTCWFLETDDKQWRMGTNEKAKHLNSYTNQLCSATDMNRTDRGCHRKIEQHLTNQKGKSVTLFHKPWAGRVSFRLCQCSVTYWVGKRQLFSLQSRQPWHSCNLTKSVAHTLHFQLCSWPRSPDLFCPRNVMAFPWRNLAAVSPKELLSSFQPCKFQTRPTQPTGWHRRIWKTSCWLRLGMFCNPA